MNYNYIAIEGNIGSGKTSLSALLAEEYNAKLVLEQFQENPFLGKFYEDKERYAFQVEMSFLTERYYQLKTELASGDLFQPKIIADYFINIKVAYKKFSSDTITCTYINYINLIFE